MTRTNSRLNFKTGLRAGQEYMAVVNDRGQFAVWDSSRELGEGWRSTGFSGTQQEVSAFLERLWGTRPASLGGRR